MSSPNFITDDPGEDDPAPNLLSPPLAIDVDEDNCIETILSTSISQYRNSRTGNARRVVTQPDHDILEGLPIRRWHKKAVYVSTSAPDKADPAANSPLLNGYPEPEMPKDWTLLSEHCQAILLAARRGTCTGLSDNGEDRGAHSGNKDYVDEKSGLLTRKWALFSKDFEPKEREFLAKRRKGLRSLYGGSTVPMSVTGQMRKIKIRNVDSEGNSQVVEAFVPEGQTVDAEIMEEELTSPTQALAPGTKVEGVGIANSEGVLVPAEQITPAAQRKRPPPPKRRNKGPGRGRKKKVAFVSGAEISTAPAPLQMANNTTQKAAENNDTNGVQSANGDNEGDDSVMQDIGQDGEDGSEDASEVEDGDEGQREEGEISATPEAEDSKSLSPLKIEPEIQTPEDTELNRRPTAAAPEIQAVDEKMLDQPVSVQHKEVMVGQLNDSNNARFTESSISITAESHPPSENAPAKVTPAPEVETHISPQPSTVDDKSVTKVAISDAHPQDSFEATNEQHIPPPITEPPLETSDPPPNTSSSFLPDSISIAHESVITSHASVAENEQESSVTQASQLAHAEQTSSNLSHPQVHSTLQTIAVDLVESVEPDSETKAPQSQHGKSEDVSSDLAPPISATTTIRKEQETSQSTAIESGYTILRHHTPHAPTPEAPTPSPPTPLPIAFDPHQRERLMESPRAPTMSPPTPARDLSSSPDLPLAGYRPPPPLTLGSAADATTQSSGPKFSLEEDGADMDAASMAVENPAPEIAHKFSDGEEDLLGSLERSLEKSEEL